MQAYEAFLARKAIRFEGSAITPARPIGSHLFDFQRHVVEWALATGRAAVFGDCGTGKTVIQLEWASHIDGPVLLIAPLAVTGQTCEEAARFDYDARFSPDGTVNGYGVTVTNYERMERFDPSDFAGFVLDEASILKGHDRAFANTLLTRFGTIPYRLSCSATPAPNDYMELGTQAQFLGALTKAEMLALFFTHDGGDTQTWRLKRYGRRDFWSWVGSWAKMFRKPSDLGPFDDSAFELPPLEISTEFVRGPRIAGELFASHAPLDLNERRRIRRESLGERCRRVAALVGEQPAEQWILWCDLNDEADELARLIPGAVEVSGSDEAEDKARFFSDFGHGKLRVLITKPKIAAYGLNWQSCARVAFCGLSDSYEAFYQAVRRCWRFGQTRPVHVHVVASDADRAVVANVARKEGAHRSMVEEMVAA